MSEPAAADAPYRTWMCVVCGFVYDEALGLPETLVWRHPFPGPGLGVRIIGEVTPDKVAILQRADAIVREEIRAAGKDDFELMRD